MWINIIRDKYKPISAVELLVLTSVPEIPTKASEIMDIMNKKSIHWIVEKGSVHPILHRLTGIKPDTIALDDLFHVREITRCFHQILMSPSLRKNL